ncbi:hypothetical protein ACFC4G_19880 [Streptomyces sp. NPDC056002]|uniref:hypothetical protein n=1 Tax=Streptomyces sp. NPDC056002 TaxID=3345675 RepID=UPI0035D85933
MQGTRPLLLRGTLINRHGFAGRPGGSLGDHGIGSPRRFGPAHHDIGHLRGFSPAHHSTGHLHRIDLGNHGIGSPRRFGPAHHSTGSPRGFGPAHHSTGSPRGFGPAHHSTGHLRGPTMSFVGHRIGNGRAVTKTGTGARIRRPVTHAPTVPGKGLCGIGPIP